MKSAYLMMMSLDGVYFRAKRGEGIHASLLDELGIQFVCEEDNDG